MDEIFFQAVLNSLDEQIAIIDQKGVIVFVNDSWIRFGAENGAQSEYGWLGTNYLDACKTASAYGDEMAVAAAEGIASVISGKERFFYLEYPCHSPNEKRWYILRAAPVRGFGGRAFVLSHQNITRRKLAEEAAAYSSMHDPLTGLPNRRHFERFLADQWNRSRRNEHPLSVLMIDLDHFKQYNDEHGHLAGDNCLKAVAEILRTQSTRATDLSARFGGDEFLMVLGDTPPAGALSVAEKILEKIRNIGLQAASGKTVGASIGLATRIPGAAGDCADESALVALADAALYKAKTRGRNRIETA